MSTVIKVENIGKQYNLGQVGTGTISNDVKRWWHKVRGKEDPFLKIGETNDRTKKGDSNLVWALKDINFEVKQGEVLGIIGKNGAGKSTLLKILSRVTAPTIGEIKVKGRIASLLEVGTGFHPDLTGRENIFLNGAILGMTKQEIRNKFDEIVDFSGVERYIDTPVKRYSSGMYVRLAFAVAAHLEPEILIVDEVLAVGDAEFQKKCLGKMKDVSGQGRTVLFVSHNMPSMRALCSSVMLLEHGKSIGYGSTNDMIARYLSSPSLINDSEGNIPPDVSLHGTGEAKYKKLQLLTLNKKAQKEFWFKEKFIIKIQLEVLKNIQNVIATIIIVNSMGEAITMAVDNEFFKPSSFEKGNYEFEIIFEERLLPGDYSIGLGISYFHTGTDIDYIESFSNFKILKEAETKDMEFPWTTVTGHILLKTNWQIKKI
ncbi:MAG: ABC transporter ATP-binding protein [Bacteroidetes bacterium]|nr:ABC transporter ATP-binding protein [Bacteroidota bacterium]